MTRFRFGSYIDERGDLRSHNARANSARHLLAILIDMTIHACDDIRIDTYDRTIIASVPIIDSDARKIIAQCDND